MFRGPKPPKRPLRRLQKRLKIIIESAQSDPSESRTELSAADKQRLESLGYISATRVREIFDFQRDLLDPKDMIDYHEQHIKATNFINFQQYENAEKICNRLLADYPQVGYTYDVLAQIAGNQGNTEKQIGYLKKYISWLTSHEEKIGT